MSLISMLLSYKFHYKKNANLCRKIYGKLDPTLFYDGFAAKNGHKNIKN